MLWLLTTAFATDDDARDLASMLDTIEARYVYLDPATDLDALRAALLPAARAAEDGDQRVVVFERALAALLDPHATLGTNLGSSFRLVPSGADVWAEWDGDGARITAVRPGWPADRAGVRVGDRVVQVDGTPITAAVSAALPPAVDPDAPRARAVMLLAVLAGTHDHLRQWTLADGRALTLADPDEQPAPPPVTWSLREDGIGVVVVHALGDSATVPAFDDALAALRDARGLVVDLRDTAAGGSTTVAEPILGRFVRERTAYQRIVSRGGRAWARSVGPRGPWTWEKPVAVVVDRWTGSMGEGLAIGFDAAGIPVVGTPMAELRGAVRTYVLPRSGVRWNLPFQRLEHVDGTPREEWVPPHLVTPVAGEDAVLDRAVALLSPT